jgi:hypothetical protein
MPPLGLALSIDTISGVVTQIDPVRRTLTIATHEGEQIEIDAYGVPSPLAHS